MTQDKTKVIGDAEENSASPYNPFVSMENLVEKLKLLKYEKEFCKAKHQKPLSRHYFAIPTNPGEQFHSFTTLTSWLISKADGQMDPPQEYDDPNAIIATILDGVRATGQTVEFAPSKLKSGCGEHCIRVLDILADAALKAKGSTYTLPVYPEEEEEELDVEEADLSDTEEDATEWRGASAGRHLLGSKLFDPNEPSATADDDIDDEEDSLDLEALRHRGQSSRKQSATVRGSQLDGLSGLGGGRLAEKPSPDGVLESSTHVADWQLEVERVLPQLKVTIRSEAKDWRTHLEQMKRYQSEIETGFSDTKSRLTRLHDELTRALDKIGSREKYMNSQLEPLLSEYRTIQDSLSEVTVKYRQASGGISERSRTLAEVTEELERVKTEMDERGSSMTDGSPVIRIKQAIQRLKSEMVAMDIRTGVLEHILLRMHLRAREDSQKPLFTRDKEQCGSNGSTQFVY